MNFLLRIQGVIQRHPIRSSFFVVLSVLLFLNLPRSSPVVFYADSANYWGLGGLFIKDGVFSLTNYNNSLRGYLFPFLLFCLQELALISRTSEYLVYEVVMSLVYTTFLVVWVPNLIQRLFDVKSRFLPIVAFSGLTIIFWHGTFFYPLSDFPAFIFLVIGTIIFLHFQKHWWTSVLAGIFWGGAALIRPSYAITLPLLIIWTIYCYRKNIKLLYLQIAGRLFAILIGLTIVFTPQMIINTTHWGIASPFVLTSIDGPSLFVNQLYWGMVMQKYETNFGETYPDNGVRFYDKQGEGIINTSGIPSSTSDYLKLIFHYPLDFMTMYIRHLFNGLDVVYNSTYVTDLYNSATLLRLINYSIWFLVVLFFTHLPRLRQQKHFVSSIIICAILLSPAIVSIPTAIEVRFMIPLQLMAYALVAFWILPKFLSSTLLQKKMVINRFLFSYFVFLALCFMISANTYSSLEYGPPYLLSGN